MTSSGALRIDRLELGNFRCFKECEVELHPKLTVLVAENGRGKTAILDATSIALGLFVDTLAGLDQWHGFERSDAHLVRGDGNTMTPALPVKLTAHGWVNKGPIRWSRSLDSLKKRARTTTWDTAALRGAATAMRKHLDDFAAGDRHDPPVLPVAAFYGTGRLWSEHRLTSVKRVAEPNTMSRVLGYIDCLSSSSSFKTFVDWYRKNVELARSPAGRAFGMNERPALLLAAVREATRTMLEPTRWDDIDWDLDQGTLVVEHPGHGRLPLSVLSDGVRNMIALVADLAHRCARLNPQFGEHAAKRTPGILLIDEVDMHLHPRWQQLVMDLLQKTFPAMQMVVSTHSPHVLSTVEKESIRVVRLQGGKGLLETPTFQTRGVESADVLATIMGVDPVPQVEEARWLSDYRALIQTDRHGERAGEQLWSRLVAHFTEGHPVMQELATLQRLQAFKKLHNLPGRGGA